MKRRGWHSVLQSRLMSDLKRTDQLADIDSAADPEPWLRMLRGMWPGTDEKRERYRRLFARLQLEPSSRILEVGCGAGGATAFAASVIPKVHLAVGVDPSQLAVAEAVHRMLRLNPLSRRTQLRFAAMDGRRLAFADGTFDAVFCTRVLVHAPQPRHILAEMIRVVRPGGALLIVEPDRDALLSSVECDHVNRVFWSTKRSLNPSIGRQLYPFLREFNLTVETVEPSISVSLQPPSEELVAEWESELETESGERWDLVASGMVTADDMRTYVQGLRQARETNSYLRCDLELAYVARRAC